MDVIGVLVGDQLLQSVPQRDAFHHRIHIPETQQLVDFILEWISALHKPVLYGDVDELNDVDDHCDEHKYLRQAHLELLSLIPIELAADAAELFGGITLFAPISI